MQILRKTHINCFYSLSLASVHYIFFLEFYYEIMELFIRSWVGDLQWVGTHGALKSTPRFTELKSLSTGPQVYILKNFPDDSDVYPRLRTPYESQHYKET